MYFLLPTRQIFIVICAAIITALPAQVWEPIEFPSSEVSALAIDPTDENVIWAGTAGSYSDGTVGSLYMTKTGGSEWYTLLTGISVLDIDIHPNNPNTVFVTSFGNMLSSTGVLKTSNGGLTWAKSDSNVYFDWETGPVSLAIHPVYPDTIFLSTGGAFGGPLYVSHEGGDVWQEIEGPLSLNEGARAITIDKNNPQTIYIGTSYRGSVVKSTDGGSSWVEIAIGLTSIRDIAIHPDSSNVIWLGTKYYGILRSNDGGVTWREINEGLPVNPGPLEDPTVTRILVSAGGEVLYCTVNDRVKGAVYRYERGSDGWTIMGGQTWPGGVETIELTPSGNRLILGLKHDGLMAWDFAVNSSHAPSLPRNFQLKQNHPNPFNNQTIITFSLREAAMIQLNIYDLNGRLVERLFHGYQAIGDYEINYAPSSLASGIYVYGLDAGGESLFKKFTLIK